MSSIHCCTIFPISVSTLNPLFSSLYLCVWLWAISTKQVAPHQLFSSLLPINICIPVTHQLMIGYMYTHISTRTHTGTQTDRQTDRQTDSHTHICTHAHPHAHPRTHAPRQCLWLLLHSQSLCDDGAATKLRCIIP